MNLFDRFKSSKKPTSEKKPDAVVREEKKSASSEKATSAKAQESAKTNAAVVVRKEQSPTKVKSGGSIKTPAQRLLAARTLLRPHITEKSTLLQHQHQIVFEVPLHSNKIEIKKAIEVVYGVRPKKIQIVRLPRKNIWFGRTPGQTKLKKKAIAVFAPDQNMEVFSHV